MKKYQRKIAVFLPSLGGDGAERVMLNLAGEFARRGVPVGLLLAAAEGPYLKDVPADVWIVDLAAGRIRSSILRDLRHEKPTVLLSAIEHSNCAAVIVRDLAGSATQWRLHSTTHPQQTRNKVCVIASFWPKT